MSDEKYSQYADDIEAWGPDGRLTRRREHMIYKLRLSALYHLKRERFFGGVDKGVSSVIAITASASVVVLLKKIEAVDFATSAFTAAFAIFALVFNPAEKARHHARLASEFRRLLAEGETLGERWSEEACNRFSGRAIEVEGAESSPLTALVAECENQLSVGRTEERLVHLRWYQKLLKNIVDFDAADLHTQRPRAPFAPFRRSKFVLPNQSSDGI